MSDSIRIVETQEGLTSVTDNLLVELIAQELENRGHEDDDDYMLDALEPFISDSFEFGASEKVTLGFLVDYALSQDPQLFDDYKVHLYDLVRIMKSVLAFSLRSNADVLRHKSTIVDFIERLEDLEALAAKFMHEGN